MSANGFSLSDEARAMAERIVTDRDAAAALDSLRHAPPELPPPSSWAPVDLGPVLAGEQLEPEPTILRRSDGPGLLYSEKLHSASGEPEACKGWLACLATVALLAARRRVVYIDFEDSEASIVARLRALGCNDEDMLAAFTYLRPHEPLTDATRPELDSTLALEPALVVIDGLTEAMTIHGLDLGDNADVARWLDLLPRRVGRAGAAVLMIDHVVKDREARGRYSLGAQHKLAGIDVAYVLEVIDPFGRGRDGLVKVKVTKDRPGHVRAHGDGDGRIADMRLVSDLDSGAVSISLDPPDAQPAFRPTVLMRRVSEAVAAESGLSTSGIERGVKGKTDAVREALRLLVAEGYIDARQEGTARRHYLLRPFVEPPDLAPSPQGRPDLAPAHQPPDLAPSPLPFRGSEAGGEPSLNGHEARPRPSTPAESAA